MTDVTRFYVVALLSLLCVAILVLQSYGGTHVYCLTVGGVILLGCVYRSVDLRSMKIACVLCIVILVVRSFIL